MKRGLLFALLFMAALHSEVFARTFPSVVVAEDVGNGYRFEIPEIGGFTANSRDGETVAVGVITLDQGLTALLYRDGEETVFRDSMAITDNGAYELHVFRGAPGERADYGIYRFQIENHYEGIGADSAREIRLIENPEMIPTYLAEKGMYRYRLPSGRYFDTSVPLGAWTDTQIELVSGQGVNLYAVRKDGTVLATDRKLLFREAGSYEIGLRSNELGFEGDESYKIDAVFHLFRKEIPVTADRITAPLGFTPERCRINGKEAPLSGGDSLELRRDGSYEIEFLKQRLTPEEEPVRYTVTLLRDTTAPALRFSENISDGPIRRGLSFSSSEADAEISIFKNYQRVVATGDRISQNGSYRITVRDRVGNQREYRFVIQKALRIFTPLVIVIPIMLLALCAVVVRYWKRNMRVL